MLAEILLCGLASANMGMKSVSVDFSTTDTTRKMSYINDATPVEPSAKYKYDSVINERASTFYNGVANETPFKLNEVSCYVKNNIWYNEQTESEYNDYIIQADVISPYFGKGYSQYISDVLRVDGNQVSEGAKYFYPEEKEYPKPTEYVDYDGFYNKVNGTCNPNTHGYADTDYFRFYLYGLADVSINFNGPSDVKMYLQFYDSEKLELEETRFSPENGEICVNLPAGTYYICVYSKDKEHSYNYDFDISAQYAELDEDTIDIGFDWSELQTQGVAWISDFEPLNSTPFYGVNKNTPSDKFSVFLTTSIEGAYLNQRLLQSSLIIWGNEFKKAYRDFLNDSAWEEGRKFLEKHRNEEIRVTREQKDAENGLFVVKLVLSFASEKADVIITIGDAIEQFSGSDASRFGSIFDPLIQQEKERQIKGEQFLWYLDHLKDKLNDSITYNSVLKIDSWYQLKWNGNNDNVRGSIDLEYIYDAHTCRNYENYNSSTNILKAKDFEFAAQSKGSFYRIKYASDMKSAQNHWSHHYTTEEVKTTDCKQLRQSGTSSNLPLGLFDWYYFTAPYSGTYSFYSYDDDYKNPSWNLVGELFDEPISGRNPYKGGFILEDDSGGSKGHFKIHYYLEANETIYLRVHEKTWNKPVPKYCLKVDPVRIDYTVPYNDSFYSLPNIVFMYDATQWIYLKFENPGYKVIQSFTSDVEGSIELFNSRGESISKGENKNNGTSNTGVVSAYVNNTDTYMLKIYSPKSYREYYEGATGNVVVTSVNELSVSNETIMALKNGEYISNDSGEYDNIVEYEINNGESAFAYFTPEIPGFYEFYCSNLSDYSIDMNIYDLNTGRTISPESCGYFLEDNHTYFVLAKFSDYEEGHGTIKIGVHYHEEYEMGSHKQVETILANQTYVEKVINVIGEKHNDTNCANDYYFKFERYGDKIFNLSGIEGNYSTNAVLKLYDGRNKLLASDDGGKGSWNNAYISYEIHDDEVYRVRVEATTIGASTHPEPLKLSIMTNNGSDKFPTMGNIIE